MSVPHSAAFYAVEVEQHFSSLTNKTYLNSGAVTRSRARKPFPGLSEFRKKPLDRSQTPSLGSVLAKLKQHILNGGPARAAGSESVSTFRAERRFPERRWLASDGTASFTDGVQCKVKKDASRASLGNVCSLLERGDG